MFNDDISVFSFRRLFPSCRLQLYFRSYLGKTPFRTSMLMVSSLVLQSSPLQKYVNYTIVKTTFVGVFFEKNITHIFSSQLGVARVHFIQCLQEIQTHLKHRKCLKLSINRRFKSAHKEEPTWIFLSKRGRDRAGRL
jgi:hypothetical protein